MSNSLKWFIGKIGKTIYRKTKNKCDCYMCQKSNKNGFVVLNIEHAKSLYTASMELGSVYTNNTK